MATKTNTQVNNYQYYRITKTVGYTNKDGKKTPIKKQFYGTSKGAAEKKYDEYLKEQAKLKYVSEYANDMATLHDRSRDFIENVLMPSAKYAKGTKERYKSAYTCHIEGTYLDKMAVSEIKPSTIQQFYNDLVVSKTTLKNINKFVSVLYKWMALNGYADNVLAAVEMPAKEDTSKSDTIIVWPTEDWNTLKSTIFGFRHDFLIKLLCYTGMRIGECLGLKYADIEDNIIHVRRQYYMGEIKEPKYNSKRDIPMHRNLIEAYKRHKEIYGDTDYIFTTESGKLYDVSDLRRAFARFYHRQGITPMHFHVYRATFCTELCRAGAPLEVASKILGHKSLEVTAKHYALVKQDSMVDAINLLD